MPLSNAEIDAVIAVLWHTHAVRSYYEDRALFEDDIRWKNNGGLFPNLSRYHSQKWKDMIGPLDPSVRGRSISSSSMAQARRLFEEHYREPIYFALQLVERIRSNILEAVEKDGSTDDGELEEQAGSEGWQDAMSDPEVRDRFIKLAQECSNVDTNAFHI